MISLDYQQILAGAREHRHRTGLPFVTLSYAQSLDGSIGARRGTPSVLSGPEALTLTHQLRRAHNTILVGIGTVLADNPRLTVRLVEGGDPQPVVLDSRLRFPPYARILQYPKPPWIFATESADQEKQDMLEAIGARVFRFPQTPRGRLDLQAVLSCLAEMAVDSLMVEGGASVITSFLRLRLVNYIVLTIAPMFVGGLPAVEKLLVDTKILDSQAANDIMAHFPRLQNMAVTRLGPDLVLWGEFA